MKHTATQQEVLLIMNSSFASREWVERNESEQKPFDAREQMQEGAWSGVLRYLLPEVFVKSDDNKDLTLWQIREAESFLELELGDLPTELERETSVNPYLFVPTLNIN